jgi:hypothetical protein
MDCLDVYTQASIYTMANQILYNKVVAQINRQGYEMNHFLDDAFLPMISPRMYSYEIGFITGNELLLMEFARFKNIWLELEQPCASPLDHF